MVKSTVGDWSTTASSNTDVGGVNIAENCAAANINNAIRELMAQIATGIGVDLQAYDAGLASIAGLTTANGKFLFLTASDTYAVGTIGVQTGAIYSTVGGTANAVTLTTGLSLTALTEGMKFRFVPTANNTGATTVAIDGLGSRPVVSPTGSALGANFIVSGVEYEGFIDSSFDFVLSAPYIEGTFTVTVTPATSGSITLNSAQNTLAYTKVGRLVTVTGMLGVTSVSSPVGATMTIGNLPFPIGNLAEISGRFGSFVTRVNSGGVFAIAPMYGVEGNSTLTYYQDASAIGASTQLYFNFSYFTD